MMPKGLAREAWLINNPALGAYMLWIFARECFEKQPKAIHPSKLFCVFPFLFYSDTRSILSSTVVGSNLHSFISKLSSTKKQSADVALSIHKRVDEQKEKTFESLLTAFDSGLLLIDMESGGVTPNSEIHPIKRVELDETTKELFDCTRKLGKWFSDLDTEDIKRIAKVVF